MAAFEAPTPLDYCEAVDRYLDSLDDVLAAGRQAQQRQEAFFRRHGIEPGSGAEALTNPALPPGQRYAHRLQLALLERSLNGFRAPHATRVHALPPLWEDPFTRWLRQARPDLPLAPRVIANVSEDPVGWQLGGNGVLVTYFVSPAEPTTMHLVEVAAERRATGLRSPLLGLVAFARLIKASGPSPRWLRSAFPTTLLDPANAAGLRRFLAHYAGFEPDAGGPDQGGRIDLQAMVWPQPRSPAARATRLRRLITAAAVKPSSSLASRALGSRTRI